MTDLFWPGSHRAGSTLSSAAYLAAMVQVEDAWLAELVRAGVAPAEAQLERGYLATLVGAGDVEVLSEAAEAGGNPVIPLVKLLRERLGEHAAATWLHRGMTSQDVVDTALVLCLRDAINQVLADVDAQVARLASLAQDHAETVMAARTLTQQAIPTTFGAKAATWLDGVVGAGWRLREARDGLTAQFGGAAGTLAATVELARTADLPAPPDIAQEVSHGAARRLGLPAAMPWHTSRGSVTRVGDAFVTATDAWGHLASDVATLSRSEIGEVREGAAGGSSTMPNKANPVLSVLLRRSALTAPGLASTLHLASAMAVDERPDGAWHAEWAALAALGRMAVVASGQARDLVAGLVIRADVMEQNLAAAGDALMSEQRSMQGLRARGGQGVEGAGLTYIGLASHIVQTAVDEAARYLTDVGAQAKTKEEKRA